VVINKKKGGALGPYGPLPSVTQTVSPRATPVGGVPDVTSAFAKPAGQSLIPGTNSVTVTSRAKRVLKDRGSAILYLNTAFCHR
jgi:hypothetical protein